MQIHLLICVLYAMIKLLSKEVYTFVSYSVIQQRRISIIIIIVIKYASY